MCMYSTGADSNRSEINIYSPKEINWNKTKEMILSSEVETIIQAHDPKVILGKRVNNDRKKDF